MVPQRTTRWWCAWGEVMPLPHRGGVARAGALHAPPSCCGDPRAVDRVCRAGCRAAAGACVHAAVPRRGDSPVAAGRPLGCQLLERTVPHHSSAPPLTRSTRGRRLRRRWAPTDAKGLLPDELVVGASALLGIVPLFACLPLFWALHDAQGEQAVHSARARVCVCRAPLRWVRPAMPTDACMLGAGPISHAAATCACLCFSSS